MFSNTICNYPMLDSDTTISKTEWTKIKLAK
nr:MAG TPA: hypothetical protein [Caudoviricetes sp.]